MAVGTGDIQTPQSAFASVAPSPQAREPAISGYHRGHLADAARAPARPVPGREDAPTDVSACSVGAQHPRPEDAVGHTGERAFIGSFTSSGGLGITIAAVDPATGRLTQSAVIDGVPDPSFLTIDHADSGHILYAVSEAAQGAVAAYDVEGPEPHPVGVPIAVEGEEPTHLTVVQGHLLTANYGSGSVSVMPLASDGSPRTVSDVHRHAGSGPDPDRQSGPHAHQVLPDPSERWALGVDL
ncbi:lactonase family protein [Streptomyces sp. C1-2]|nr:lactonase family protein [Streptomyces sp. C1-2]